MNEPHDRRDDWRHGVDENLASLNAGQRVWERDLGIIRNLLADIDILLRGDIGAERSGLVGRMEKIEGEMAKISAVLFMDSTGKKGLVHDVEQLQGGREDWRGIWKNITSIVVAAIMSGLVTHFWSDIRLFLTRKSADPVDQMIDSAKHPKGRPIVRYRVRRVRAEDLMDPEPEPE